MQFYDGGWAPNARRVRIFLAEKGISVPVVPVDLSKGEHKTPEFTKLNPLQCVPVLVLDDGTVLTESIAICRYFEELHPETPLFGTTPKGKALVEMWQRRLEFELYTRIGHAFRHLHPRMAASEVPQVAAWGQANSERVVRFMRQLDADLEGKSFIAGDSFSVADITGLISLDFTKVARITIPEDLANVRRWHATLSARPSAKA